MPDLVATLQAVLADRYLLARELGRGGMATVYLARDLKHDRDVAVKVLRPELAAVLGRERFLTEIRLTAKLDHPHILTLIDSGESGGFLWYVVPLVRGESLRQKLLREKQLSLEEALRIVKQVGAALDYAHSQGVIHRDLKPENILLHEGEAMLADFGIALALKDAAGNRLTETGLSLGTPQYMSPEQATAEPRLDGRSDQYSLACVVYEMLAGEPPHTGTAQAVIAKRLSEPVPRVGTLREVPSGIEAAVTRALARSPADRFATTAEFASALTDTTDAARRPWPTRAIRRRLAIGSILAAALATGSFLLTRRPAFPEKTTTIAVLPVRDLNLGDSSAFAAGLTEDLGAAAAAIPGLFVVSSRSAAAAKQESDDPRALGRRLGVSALLEATVRTSGDKLRVVARLIRARDGGVLWSDVYDRSRTDVIAIQNELVGAVANALRLRLSPDAVPSSDQVRLVDPKAYDLYSRAVQLRQHQRSSGDVLAAAALLDSAIRVDPGFGKAYGELGFVLLSEVDFGVPYEQVGPALERAVARGRAADPDDPRTLAVASIIAGRRRLPDSAHSLIQRAVSRAPGDAQVRIVSAGRLTDLLRLRDAHRETQLALQLAPLDVFAIAIAGWTFVRLGEHQEAVDAAESAIALDSTVTFHYIIRGMARICQGKWGQGFDDLGRGQGTGFFGIAMLGIAQALHGNTVGALEVVRRLKNLQSRNQALPISISWIYSALGQADSTFVWLKRAESAGNLYTGIADIWFDWVASDPRWLRWARRDLGDSAAVSAQQELLARPRCRP